MSVTFQPRASVLTELTLFFRIGPISFIFPIFLFVVFIFLLNLFTMKNILCFLTLCASISLTGSWAQSLSPSVLASSGQLGSNGGTQLAWTLGEGVIATLDQGEARLTQGFHQPRTIPVANDPATPSPQLWLARQGAQPWLTIEALQTNQTYQLLLIDLQGRRCLQTELSGPAHRLSLAHLPDGAYVARLQNGQGQTWQQALLLRP